MTRSLPQSDIESLRPDVLALARSAGRAILACQDRDRETRRKADGTPVTTADLVSHHLLNDGLARLTPDIPVISEEAPHAERAMRRSGSACWLVDPLDGTRDFIADTGEYVVSIALVAGQRAVLGVVVAPALELAWFATSGGGAYRQAGDGAVESLRVRRAPAEGLTLARSRHRPPGRRLECFLERVGIRETLVLGSAMKTCVIAEGRADLYAQFGDTSEWDTAAAQCILEEAGGSLTDTTLRPLRYNARDTLINPPFLAIGDSTVNWHEFLQDLTDWPP